MAETLLEEKRKEREVCARWYKRKMSRVALQIDAHECRQLVERVVGGARIEPEQRVEVTAKGLEEE